MTAYLLDTNHASPLVTLHHPLRRRVLAAIKAIAREKQLKGWRRSKKVALIEAANPTWRDLAME